MPKLFGAVWPINILLLDVAFVPSQICSIGVERSSGEITTSADGGIDCWYRERGRSTGSIGSMSRFAEGSLSCEDRAELRYDRPSEQSCCHRRMLSGESRGYCSQYSTPVLLFRIGRRSV